jgi:hypothetical protein
MRQAHTQQLQHFSQACLRARQHACECAQEVIHGGDDGVVRRIPSREAARRSELIRHALDALQVRRDG